MTFKRLGASKEERIAIQIGKALTDFTTDLEAVGYYLSKQPYIVYSRAMEVLESAEFQKESVEYNRMGYYNDRLF
jgi:hypothetical protein